MNTSQVNFATFSYDCKRTLNEQNMKSADQLSSFFGIPLGLASKPYLTNDQIELSSGTKRPRLLESTWTTTESQEPPWVQVYFHKFVMVKAIQLMSPVSNEIGNLARVTDISIEYRNESGEFVRMEEGDQILFFFSFKSNFASCHELYLA